MIFKRELSQSVNTLLPDSSHSALSVSIDSSCLNQFLHQGLQHGDFPILVPLHILASIFCTTIFLLFLSFPAPRPALWIHGSFGFFLTQCYNPLLSSFFLRPKLFHIWPLGAPSSWVLCPFDTTLTGFGHLLPFCHKHAELALHFTRPRS